MSPYGWAMTKARENEARHGVSFDEAATVLDNALAHWAQDLEHSEQEDRTRVVGWSAQGRLLIVIVSATGDRPESSPHGVPRSTNDMRTSIGDPDLEIPEIDFSRVTLVPNPFARKPGEQLEIRIDGAVGYNLRLIPSNKVLARFASTLEAWPVIISTVAGGRSPRTLSLDWRNADGQTGSISAGPRLERWARLNNGEPRSYAGRAARRPRRVAETE